MDLHEYDNDIIHDENDEEGDDVTDSLDDKRVSKQNKPKISNQLSPTEQSSDGSIGSGSGMDDDDGTSISQNG